MVVAETPVTMVVQRGYETPQKVLFSHLKAALYQHAVKVPPYLL